MDAYATVKGLHFAFLQKSSRMTCFFTPGVFTVLSGSSFILVNWKIHAYLPNVYLVPIDWIIFLGL